MSIVHIVDVITERWSLYSILAIVVIVVWLDNWTGDIIIELFHAFDVHFLTVAVVPFLRSVVEASHLSRSVFFLQRLRMVHANNLL